MKIAGVRSMVLLLLIILQTGCGKTNITIEETVAKEISEASETISELEKPTIPEPLKPAKPVTEEMDWAGYFDGMNGAAVFYNPGESRYMVYNQELSEVRRSPCSTFKIISSLAGLERGVIRPEDSVRPWSGEVFWNEDWNQDIDFPQAFKTSCIWYFREVTDELGQEAMQEELNRLQYGNCDISDWEGRLNTNNNNRALTGFWVESSLKISAKEQTEVMERIFNANSVYQPKTLEQLKQVMLVTDQTISPNPIYGKTGMGKAEGRVIDSWFTGFAGTQEGDIYFCVYLGRTDGAEVSSKKAKEIAIQIAADCFPG